jgi:nitrite reductase/ring-hydroxylating ferredoxin subunit/uncharacterized membrane protein
MALEAAVSVVERQHWLDPVGEKVQGAIAGMWESAGSAGQLVKNFLHGVWLGHPLHPVLTDVPIGAWSVTLALDAADTIAGRNQLHRGADAALTLGIAGAVGAAVTGINDWQHTRDRSRRVGMMHAMLNTVALGFYVGSLVLRRQGRRDAGRGMATLGFGVAMASAYLGGNLVFHHRVGVNHADERLRTRPRDFVPVLAENALAEGAMKRVEVDGMRVLVSRRHGEIFAIGETCSHMGGPLAEGQLEGDSVRCPWHGSRFALEDGRVLDGPATFSQPCFDTRMRGGQIEVRAGRG